MLFRRALPNDYHNYSRLFSELSTYDPTPTAQVFEQDIMPNMMVLDKDGQMITFAYIQSLQTTGYVRQIVVDSNYRRKGFGHFMMLEVIKHFRAVGCNRMCLNVKVDNYPALNLYNSFGMSERYRSNSLRFPWSMVHDLHQPQESCFATPLDLKRAIIVEKKVGLLPGQLARFLKSPRHIVLELKDETETCLGVAAFNPQFPGAFPFRVVQKIWAKPLLLALEPYALPELSYMQIVVENDDSLTEMLVNNGAQIRVSLIHLDVELGCVKYSKDKVFTVDNMLEAVAKQGQANENLD